MKVTGEATLNAPVDQVWAALLDPAVLVRTIPGCERLEATGENSYAMTVTAGVASIKGSYAGTVSLTDLPDPNAFLMKAAGAGGPGTVSADVTVTLTEAALTPRWKTMAAPPLSAMRSHSVMPPRLVESNCM